MCLIIFWNVWECTWKKLIDKAKQSWLNFYFDGFLFGWNFQLGNNNVSFFTDFECVYFVQF